MPILGVIASSLRTAPDTGAMFPLQVITVGPAGASEVNFTNIPGTYTHLQIRAIAPGSNDSDIWIRFNSDTGSNYAAHRIYGDGSSVSAGANTTSTKIDVAARTSGSSSIPAPAVIDILDYANNNKYKTSRSFFGWDNNGSGYIMFSSGLWMNTSAITSIKLFPQVGSFQQYAQFALYAVKGA